MAARRLRERQVEGERVIEALEAALAADGEQLLEAAERARIDAALDDLRRINAASDPAAIEAAIGALEQCCEFYVERRMNRSIRQAMAGHKLEDFE